MCARINIIIIIACLSVTEFEHVDNSQVLGKIFTPT